VPRRAGPGLARPPSAQQALRALVFQRLRTIWAGRMPSGLRLLIRLLPLRLTLRPNSQQLTDQLQATGGSSQGGLQQPRKPTKVLAWSGQTPPRGHAAHPRTRAETRPRGAARPRVLRPCPPADARAGAPASASAHARSGRVRVQEEAARRQLRELEACRVRACVRTWHTGERPHVR
jgi:hypothetical protein